MTEARIRVVVVTRPTPLEQLIHRYGTYGQAQFYLSSRGQDIRWLEENHERVQTGLALAVRGIPENLSYVRVSRDDLDRFLFGPDDRILIVGQDGLVPNVAKYLNGQWALGVNPDPGSYDGVLCRHAPAHVGQALRWQAGQPGFRLEQRTLAEAELDNGQTLLAMNELFIGHVSHQSARYRIRVKKQQERHSSSGVIVATGTGASGWARSICQQRKISDRMPTPEEARLAWFVREPWPSVATQAGMDFGLTDADTELELDSEMSEGGVIFADGIEADRIEFVSGRSVRIRVAKRRLNLLVPSQPPPKAQTKADATPAPAPKRKR